MMLKVVKHQVIAGQLIKLKVVNYSRLRPLKTKPEIRLKIQQKLRQKIKVNGIRQI